MLIGANQVRNAWELGEEWEAGENGNLSIAGRIERQRVGDGDAAGMPAPVALYPAA